MIISPPNSGASQGKRISETLLENALMACGVALMMSWPFHHTIALRYSSLSLGFVLSISWFVLRRPKFLLKDYSPLLLLAAVPFWLLIHALLFPVSLINQWAELKTLWLRVALGIPFAFVLGILIANKKSYRSVMLVAFSTYPAIMLGMWLFATLGGHPSPPSQTYIFKTKVGGVFYLMWPCLMGYALIEKSVLNFARSTGKDVPKFFLSIFLAITLVAASIFGMVLLDSLLGIIISIGVGLMMIAACLRHFSFGWKKNSFSLFLTMIIIFVIFLNLGNFYKTHSPQFQSKFVPLLLDARKSLNTEHNRTWQRSTQVQGIPDPINANGQPVNVSTYERVSWLIEGIKDLFQNPLGTGYALGAFHFFMANQYPGSTVFKTHCGWLDIALGLGIPGLLLLWSVFGALLNKSLISTKESHKSIQLVVIWMLIGLWVLLWPAELGEPDYLEAIFFALALFAGALIPKFNYENCNRYYNQVLINGMH